MSSSDQQHPRQPPPNTSRSVVGRGSNAAAAAAAGGSSSSLRVSEAADRFHRAVTTPSSSSSSSNNNSNSRTNSRSHSPAKAIASEGRGKSEGVGAKSYLSPPTSAPNSGSLTSDLLQQQSQAVPIQGIDRGAMMQSSGSLGNITSGFHVPPQVLGQAVDDTTSDDDETNNGHGGAWNGPRQTGGNKKHMNGGSSSSAATNRRGDSGKNRAPTGLLSPDLNKGARRRSILAVKATKTQAAAAAAVKGVIDYTSSSSSLSSSKAAAKATAVHDGTSSGAAPAIKNSGKRRALIDTSIFTAMNYQGMEVIFSTTGCMPKSGGQVPCIVGICSRTHFLFQKLNVASSAAVVSITSDSTSGMIVVTHQDGKIRTYMPVPTDPINLQNDDRDADDEEEDSDAEPGFLMQNQQQMKKQFHRPKSVYGRFRWIDGTTLDAAEVFYREGEVVSFGDRRYAPRGSLVDVSTSYNGKLLVAHRQQLAVFDAAPLMTNDSDRKNPVNQKSKKDEKKDISPLLWTTLLQSNVVTAKLSGDGQAIVVVLSERDNKGRFGAHTFLHDPDDGSKPPISRAPPTTSGVLEPNASIGMVFKPGPFLSHSTPIARLSFRGLGHLTPSANPDEIQGNDLLLTYCAEDSAIRIFNQNSWRQLMLWAAPPNSRADWIRGSSAFSLGDLESQKKNPANSRMIRPGSRRPSGNSSAELSGGIGGTSSALQNTRPGASGSPTSSAGAWIAEITFRGAYPALRLSRLSYMKRGNDDSQPAHFESIAAILPAGSILAASVLNADDMGLSIQGIWPAWNPWLSETTGSDSDGVGLSGSAMQFLGLSSVPPPNTNGMFGESCAGGTHSPPTELRIVATNPLPGNLVLMDFPLWGDDDFGAMELGSPVRNVLALSEVYTIGQPVETQRLESMDYESSRLCAKIAADARSISLMWRKQGSMSLYSTQWIDDELVFTRPTMEVAEPKTPDLLVDLSVVPLPLALPPLRLPGGTASINEDTIVAIKWWPDNSFGGPPLLVAVTKSTTLLVYEIPPPMFALEPAMPDFDSFNAASSLASGTDLYNAAVSEAGSEDEDETATVRQEYDVLVTPHPEFGLGLRLESPMDGLPAIAGSFKKNPLNDGMLPAEKTGMIQLGDELLSVNGVSLENMTFDDIIATVRHVGARAGPGEPLKMRFRPVPADRSRKNSAVVQETFSIQSSGTSSPNGGKGLESNSPHSDSASLAALLFSGSAEAQQEFGRVIAVLRQAVAPIDGDDFSDRFIVLPSNDRLVANVSRRLRAAAFVLHAHGNKVHVRRLELPLRTGLDKARNLDLGEVDLSESSDKSPTVIRAIHCVEGAGECKCFAVTDSEGVVKLLYLRLAKNESCDTEGRPYMMTHEIFSVFNMHSDSRGFNFKCASAGLFAAVQHGEAPRRTIKLWNARPDASSRKLMAVGAVNDPHFGEDYCASDIIVEPSDCDSELVDFCFLETGCLDAYPTLVAFLSTEAIAYQRRGGSQKWIPVIRFSFPGIFGSTVTTKVDEISGRPLGDRPRDAFPHILVSIRAALSSYDEKNYLLSDWHAESLLALLCTDERGSKVALNGDLKRTLLWLSDEIDATVDDNFSPNVPLLVAPLNCWGSEVVSAQEDVETEDTPMIDSAMSLLSSTTIDGAKSPEIENKKKLLRLEGVLTRHRSFNENIETSGRSRRFLQAMTTKDLVDDDRNPGDDRIPLILASMHANELRVLEAVLKIAMSPPKYGKLDPAGQFSLTIYELHKELNANAKDKKKPTNGTHRPSLSTFHMRQKVSSFDAATPKLHPQNASAGCLAALLSDYQEVLINTIRQPGGKLDWSTLRDLRLPFWLRSDNKLRQLSEEVGQKMYRDSKDILKSAIFFIIAGKKRTLMNLAAADHSESGRKFYKFMTNFDFSSERGRTAAEKNAFSLLRKNNYDAASAFFLLAEPPILKSAVETIATKMEDVDLAFLVARLVKNATVDGLGYSTGFGAGGGLGFGGILGGGGGFAGTGASTMEGTKDNESFSDWKRDIGQTAKRLILDRCLPSAREDSCLSAVLLLWVGRFDEASHWLTGLVGCNDGTVPCFFDGATVPQLQTLSKSAKKSSNAAILIVNAFVNFASGPFLLKLMKASERTRSAASLVVSNSLAKAGIEIPALRWLVSNDPEKWGGAKGGIDKSSLLATPKVTNETQPPTSSIFDAYDAPPALKEKVGTTWSAPMSSIFDSYDAPSPREPLVSSTSGQMDSSIFDSFDALPQGKTKNPTSAPPAASGGMSSSIFESFDAAPPGRPETRTAPADQMSSSIFDSFDAAPPKTPAPAPPIGAVTSSIFDSYDTPRTLKTTAPGRVTLVSSAAAVKKDEEEFFETSELREPPQLWDKWRESALVDIAARRLVRELATICSRFHCDVFEYLGHDKINRLLVTSHAAQVLQFHADGESLIEDIKSLIHSISNLSSLHCTSIVEHAIRLLQSPHQFYRTFHAVLLFLALQQVELAEDVVRNASQALIERCHSIAFSNGHVANGRQCVTYMSTLCLQKFSAHLSWQLELCLWIHRGGALPLSGLSLNEAICAVRTGFLVASWNRDFEVQETMIKQPPDCTVDDVAGKQLWSSLKIISGGLSGEKKATGTSSGGWEFLVDCRRSEATEMLRSRPTGCFIIRPHLEDHGVFTLSFKTNLVPTKVTVESTPTDTAQESGDRSSEANNATSEKRPTGPRPIKPDDVVQHAIIRLSDSGFRCGSFGPFATLMKLLEAVSASLPFDLCFDLPPTEGIIKDEGSKPSPNSIFIRKLGMHQAGFANKPPIEQFMKEDAGAKTSEDDNIDSNGNNDSSFREKGRAKNHRKQKFGIFLELLLLSELRKQLSGVATAEYDSAVFGEDNDETDSVGSISDVSVDDGVEQSYAIASRILRPFLTWCRMMEVGAVSFLAPPLTGSTSTKPTIPVELAASETAIEISTAEKSSDTFTHGGDAVVRRMIQPGSGVEFRTLRLGDGNENAMVVLFSKKEAVAWFLTNGVETEEEDALKRLKKMEQSRVVEPIDLRLLAPKAYKKNKLSDEENEDGAENDVIESGIRYRLVDPWEVEPLSSREAETRGASLGRQHLVAFGLGRVSSCCEEIIRSIGGVHTFELWATTRGGVSLTKALATAHAPWERSGGGDLMLIDGTNAEPSTYENSIREHLYRNALFRRLELPQRFLALIQVELLDLKNLTSPGGSLSLTVYSLLRLKRARSNAPLTSKARTLDSVATPGVKLAKSSGPNAPASWGSLVRFRYPLPEDTTIDGRSLDGDREALFKGPPSVLQVSVYEKKFMSDTFLGGADVKLDELASGGQLEEWVPLKTETHGISWFARIRLTLRFELMCLAPEEETLESMNELSPSPSIERIKHLCNVGGAQLDLKKSVSTPDILSYFESMVY